MENEAAILRNARDEPPEDQYVDSYGLVQELRMHIPPADSRAGDAPHDTFANTLGHATEQTD